MAKRRASQTIDLDQPPRSLAHMAEVRLPEERNPALFDDAAAEVLGEVMPSALQGLLVELGESDDQAKVTVHKLENQNGINKKVYLTEMHPNEFRIQDIQEFYGAGDYTFTVYGKQPGTNYRVVHANKRITVGEPRTRKSLASAPAPATQSSEMARAVAEALGKPLETMAAMMQSVLAANMNRGENRKQALEELQQLAAIAGLGKQQTNPMEQMTVTLGLLKSFSDLMGGKSGGKNLDDETGPWAVLNSAVEKFAPVLADAVQVKLTGGAPAQPKALPEHSAINGGVGAQPHMLAQPATAAGAIIQPPANAGNNGSENMLAMRTQLIILLNAAIAGADANTYAGLIYDQAPDEVIATLESDQWFEELCKLEPRFAEHRAWCESVRKLVVDALNADDVEQAAGATAAGAPGQVAGAGSKT